jgi:hypothetical protein
MLWQGDRRHELKPPSNQRKQKEEMLALHHRKVNFFIKLRDQAHVFHTKGGGVTIIFWTKSVWPFNCQK